MPGRAATTGKDDDDSGQAVGDSLTAWLRADYAAYDFGIPSILQESDELRDRARPESVWLVIKPPHSSYMPR